VIQLIVGCGQPCWCSEQRAGTRCPTQTSGAQEKEKGPRRSKAWRKTVAMMDPDRAKLQVAAVIGALLGIVTGYVVGHPLYGILIWGLIGAVVVAGAVYCYRAFR
jgi:hypothetical protein